MKKNKLKLKLVLIITLVAVVFIGVMNASYFGKKTSLTPTVQTGSVVDDSGTELVSGKIYSLPSNMVFSSASCFSSTASDGITVVATVKPDTLENKTVSWSLSWANPNSTFAKGKTVSDYVSLTPNVLNNTATVKCLQAFGEKINLTATSTFDTSKSATCVVDYAFRTTGLSLSMSYTDATGAQKNESIPLSNNLDIVWECDLLSDNTFFGGFGFVRSSVGTVLSDEYDLYYTVSFYGSHWTDIISNYADSLTTIAGKSVSGVELLQPEDLSYYVDDFDCEWHGNLLDNFYFGCEADDGTFVYEPITNHRDLIDSLVDEYIRWDGDSPLFSMKVTYIDDFSSYEVKNVYVLLGGQALNSYSVEVSLDNSGFVL